MNEPFVHGKSNFLWQCFMSPEQTGRIYRRPDTRSDIYSLGVVFYVLLTGRLPIASPSTRDSLELVHSIITKPVTPVSKFGLTFLKRCRTLSANACRSCQVIAINQCMAWKRTCFEFIINCSSMRVWHSATTFSFHWLFLRCSLAQVVVERIQSSASDSGCAQFVSPPALRLRLCLQQDPRRDPRRLGPTPELRFPLLRWQCSVSLSSSIILTRANSNSSAVRYHHLSSHSGSLHIPSRYLNCNFQLMENSV